MNGFNRKKNKSIQVVLNLTLIFSLLFAQIQPFISTVSAAEDPFALTPNKLGIFQGLPKEFMGLFDSSTQKMNGLFRTINKIWGGASSGAPVAVPPEPNYPIIPISGDLISMDADWDANCIPDNPPDEYHLSDPDLEYGSCSAGGSFAPPFDPPEFPVTNPLPTIPSAVCELAVSEAPPLAPATTAACTKFVATNGNDSNPGTESQPWKTIQHAANPESSVGPGDIVCIRGGTYNTAVNQTISGTSGQPIIYKNYPSETPVITGDGWARRWLIWDQSYIRIEGIHFENYVGQAIYMRANEKDIDGIEIINNTLIGQRVAERVDDQARSGDAIGGTTYNSGHYISNVTVQGNYLSNINTGERWIDGGQTLRPANEALSFEGLFRNLRIINNRIDNTSNIGMNVVSRPEHLGTAENVLIKGNVISNTGWLSNSASGIYLDSGGENIIIESNVTYNNANGITVGIEEQATHHDTNHVIVRNNILHDNWQNLNFGSAPFSPNTDCSENRFVLNSVAVHNTAYAEREIGTNNRFNCGYNLRWVNNIFSISDAGRRQYRENNPLMDHTTWFLDYNLFYAPSSSVGFEYNGTVYNNFLSYQSGNPHNQDQNSLEGNPLFVNETAHDFSLSAGSPAIDAGGPLTITASGGSGNTVPIHDARYFTDGFGLQGGDMIRIGGEGPYQISAVDYSSNTLTLATAAIWSTGDTVDYDYGGLAPDIGACDGGSGSTPTPITPPTLIGENPCPEGEYLDLSSTPNVCRPLLYPDRGFDWNQFNNAVSNNFYTLEECDKNALQALLDSIPVAGGTVNLPACTINVSSMIRLPSNIILQGAGIDQTILKRSGGLTNNIIRFKHQQNGIIRDLTVDGSSNEGLLISSQFSDNLLMERVKAFGSISGPNHTDGDTAFHFRYSTKVSVRYSEAHTASHGVGSKDCFADPRADAANTGLCMTQAMTLSDLDPNLPDEQRLLPGKLYSEDYAVYSNNFHDLIGLGVDSHANIGETAGNLIIRTDGSKFPDAYDVYVHNNRLEDNVGTYASRTYRIVNDPHNVTWCHNDFINSVGQADRPIIHVDENSSGVYLLNNHYEDNISDIDIMNRDSVQVCSGSEEENLTVGFNPLGTASESLCNACDEIAGETGTINVTPIASDNPCPEGQFLDLSSSSAICRPLKFTDRGFSFAQFNQAHGDQEFNLQECTQSALVTLLASIGPNGGTVNIPACTITINGSRLTLPSNIIFQGAGTDQTKFIVHRDQGIHVGTSQNIIIRDLEIDGEGLGNRILYLEDASNILFERLHVHHTLDQLAIFLGESDHVTVRYSDVHHSGRHGIADAQSRFGGASYVSIYSVQSHTNSLSTSLGGHGIDFHGSFAEIAGNKLNNNNYGVKFPAANTVYMHHNQLNDNVHRAIHTTVGGENDDVLARNVTFCQNIITDTNDVPARISEDSENTYLLFNQYENNNPETIVNGSTTTYGCTGSEDMSMEIDGLPLLTASQNICDLCQDDTSYPVQSSTTTSSPSFLTVTTNTITNTLNFFTNLFSNLILVTIENVTFENTEVQKISEKETQETNTETTISIGDTNQTQTIQTTAKEIKELIIPSVEAAVPTFPVCVPPVSDTWPLAVNQCASQGICPPDPTQPHDPETCTLIDGENFDACWAMYEPGGYDSTNYCLTEPNPTLESYRYCTANEVASRNILEYPDQECNRIYSLGSDPVTYASDPTMRHQRTCIPEYTYQYTDIPSCYPTDLEIDDDTAYVRKLNGCNELIPDGYSGEAERGAIPPDTPPGMAQFRCGELICNPSDFQRCVYGEEEVCRKAIEAVTCESLIRSNETPSVNPSNVSAECGGNENIAYGNNEVVGANCRIFAPEAAEITCGNDSNCQVSSACATYTDPSTNLCIDGSPPISCGSTTGCCSCSPGYNGCYGVYQTIPPTQSSSCQVGPPNSICNDGCAEVEECCADPSKWINRTAPSVMPYPPTQPNCVLYEWTVRENIYTVLYYSNAINLTINVNNLSNHVVDDEVVIEVNLPDFIDFNSCDVAANVSTNNVTCEAQFEDEMNEYHNNWGNYAETGVVGGPHGGWVRWTFALDDLNNTPANTDDDLAMPIGSRYQLQLGVVPADINQKGYSFYGDHPIHYDGTSGSELDFYINDLFSDDRLANLEYTATWANSKSTELQSFWIGKGVASNASPGCGGLFGCYGDPDGRPFGWPVTGLIAQDWGGIADINERSINEFTGQDIVWSNPLAEAWGPRYGEGDKYFYCTEEEGKEGWWHSGIDIEPIDGRASEMEVYSTHAGFVTYAGCGPNERGCTVQIQTTIDDDCQQNFVTQYNNLLRGSIHVDQGEYIPRHQLLGIMGSSGTGPRGLDYTGYTHTNYEIRYPLTELQDLPDNNCATGMNPTPATYYPIELDYCTIDYDPGVDPNIGDWWVEGDTVFPPSDPNPSTDGKCGYNPYICETTDSNNLYADCNLEEGYPSFFFCEIRRKDDEVLRCFFANP